MGVSTWVTIFLLLAQLHIGVALVGRAETKKYKTNPTKARSWNFVNKGGYCWERTIFSLLFTAVHSLYELAICT